VGFANAPIDPPGRFNAHAFLWTRQDGIRDLGTLPGDVYSEALGINTRRQIVGVSCTAHFASCRAFLWEGGVMSDLQPRVDAGVADHLYAANDIDEWGAIAGQAVRADGAVVAIAALPHPRCGSSSGAAPATPFALPDAARDHLRERLGLRGVDLDSDPRGAL